MRLDDYRESSNIEDQRGSGGGVGGGGGIGGLLPLLFMGRGLGCGGVVVVGIGLLLLGVNPLALLGGGDSGGEPQRAQVGFQPPAGAEGATDRFVSHVLATTEDTWGRIFQAQGQRYPAPTLVFYSGTGQSGCGVAQSAAGPFYCPVDRKVYLDTSFFDELARRFGSPGDFAQAYVIAHEVGHHVQNVTGTLDKVERAQQGLSGARANALQVRVELQADCYAGVWGRANKSLLDAGDVEEAIGAAKAIGDDTLQRQTQGRVVPDSFTHGTSAQRVKWFRTGFDSGDPAACDTFSS